SLLGMMHCARRRASFIISPTHLAIEDIGLLGRLRYSWPASSLRSIQVESKFTSDSEGGGSWSTSLVVRPQEGKPLSFLEYRPKPELEWLATALREVLGVTQHAAEPRAVESNEGPSDPATVNESTDNNKKRRRPGYSLIPFLILGAVVFVIWRQ